MPSRPKTSSIKISIERFDNGQADIASATSPTERACKRLSLDNFGRGKISVDSESRPLNPEGRPASKCKKRSSGSRSNTNLAPVGPIVINTIRKARQVCRNS